MASFAEPAVERAASTAAVYDVAVDPNDPNSAHALMLDMVGHGKRVLEVGCAGGHLTKHLVARGCVVDGVEIDPVAASVSATIAARVVIADLDRLDFADDLEPGTYDVLLFGDVLEHTRSPNDVLSLARPLLKPDGYAVISVPNVAHADVRLMVLEGRWERFDWGLLDKTHLRFFTYDLLQRMLRECGFLATQIERVVYPVFTTELAVSRESVDADVLKKILADTEAETYQFVVKAALDNGDSAVRAAIERVNALEREVHTARRDASMRVAEAELYRQNAVDAADGLHLQLEATVNELDAMKRSRAYRAVRPLARLASRLRRTGARGSG
jgi:2-polyprenyl-3-methyl-5-hydroxy-6-metoxy-1,4-benzoquinol methylase